MPARPSITLCVVGRLREAFWRDASAEYLKRLSGLTTKIEITEVSDEPTPDDASAATEAQIRDKESERLLGKLPERAFVIVCDGGGKQLTSMQLAEKIEAVCVDGESHLVFVIGGSLGLSDSVRARASFTLSFGALTFPHQLMRVMLLEQLYRAFQINRGATYHK
jgi:23S rRNA (pseudouridine1915-N3)-methyltransferase